MVTINLLLYLSMLAVIFWLLYKQAIQFRRGILKLEIPESVVVPPGKASFRGPAYNHNLNDLMILHAHKEQVDWLDFDKIAENYVSGREDTLRKIGLLLWAIWEFCRLLTLLTLAGRHVFIFKSFDSSAEELEQQLCSVHCRKWFSFCRIWNVE